MDGAMFPQPLMNHKVIQLAYVVNDLEASAHQWMKSFGVGPFYILDRPQLTNPVFRGQPGQAEFSTALAQAGDLHIELVQQHCDSASVYRDIFPKGQEGFHHVAVIAEDFDAEIARYEGQGLEAALTGASGPMRFAYVDTTPTLPFMIEVLENVPFIVNYFNNLKQACENWDGSDPIRNAMDLF